MVAILKDLPELDDDFDLFGWGNSARLSRPRLVPVTSSYQQSFPTPTPMVSNLDGVGMYRQNSGFVPLGWALRTMTMLCFVVVAALLFGLSRIPDGAESPSEVTVLAGTGDTMWSIASEYVSNSRIVDYVARMVELNDTSDVLPGQVVRLPDI